MGYSVDAEIAEYIGVKAGTISGWRKRDTLNYPLILEKFGNLNLQSILFDEFDSDNLKSSTVDDSALYRLPDADEFATIPFYPSAKTSAGDGLLPVDREPLYIKLRHYYISNTLQTTAHSLVAITIQGDSMAHELRPGDMIIVDQARRQIQEGRMYVVRINDELYIKKLSPRPNNRLMLLSLNRNYPPFEVSTDSPDFEIIGTAVTLSRTLI